MSDLNTLLALSPLDGRYATKMSPLRDIFSEFGLIKRRVGVEIHWLLWLNSKGLTGDGAKFSDEAHDYIANVYSEFSITDAERVKAIERKTNHDVKAIEYWLRERFADHPEISPLLEFIHFGCTSEDITNVAHAMMLRAGRDVILDDLQLLMTRLVLLAKCYAEVPMVARTHGQLATPTTLGKEMAVFVSRLTRAYRRASNVSQLAKWNGASGNYNAVLVAYPDVNWEEINTNFIRSLGFDVNTHTTQIEPHDAMAELFDALASINTILIGAARDFWSYISLGYFKQKVKAGEVGSSTMPHKVNPIDFENAEGNLGIANALFRQLSDKLPISRWQRDLTDSTVTRNIGVAFGHTLLAYQSFLRGLEKLEVDEARIAVDIDDAWELLAEPVQTVMRRYGVTGAYEQLKDLSRGQRVTREALHDLIQALAIPDDAKQNLLTLTPATYTGLASKLARDL